MGGISVLHLSESDVDNGGARAAHRLHQGLRSLDCHSQMLVRAKFGTDNDVLREPSLLTKASPPLSGLPLRFYPKRPGGMFSTQWVPDVLSNRVKHYKPDIVHIHAVCNGYLQIETLKRIRQPVVWTLHDMWPFTGGCHYSQDCERYKESCGACPQLGSDQYQDLSHWTLKRKASAWKKINLTLIATTSWMAECARASSLFRNTPIETIPLGLDTEKYKPYNRHFAREVFNLPQDKHLILFGAIGGTSDRRKGFHLLQPALQQLDIAGGKEEIELVIFGASKPENAIDLGFRTHYVGRLNDDISLALVYSASDVMVVPSLQEAFGQTASEALSCGTPVVAFNATGIKDIVKHKYNGYLAKPFDSEDLSQGIKWILDNREHREKLCHNAREQVLQSFTLKAQAKRHLLLYETLKTKNMLN